MSDPEIPDADRIEQHTPIGGGLTSADDDAGRLGDELDSELDTAAGTPIGVETEADIADVLEQRSTLVGDDDYPHVGDEPD